VGGSRLLRENLGIQSNIEAPVYSTHKTPLSQESLLVLAPPHMNDSIKSVDGLCAELSLAQAGKRSEGIKPGWNLVDATGVDGGCSPAVAGQEGL
jgi:hypothetical protein